MKRTRRSILGQSLATVGALGALGAATASPADAAESGSSKSPTRKELAASVNRGMAYLRGVQEKDGSWQHYPGITAVCVLGFLHNGISDQDPAVRRACDFLASLSKPNGGIYTDALGPAQELPNYNTALALSALGAAHDAKYADVVKKAQHFLSVSQYDEESGFTPKDWQYGGVGYGTKQANPDLSNLQTALEGLADSGYPKDASVFKKAITFIQRCQNRSESNDQQWAGTDGGFIYAANGNSKADEYTKQAHSSYGSMTYAGVKSYLYCSVTKSDPRVQSAFNWIRANYTTEQNPKMGDDGLYYYYHTMSKTLALWGQRTLQDTAGRKHQWGTELTQAIVQRQQPDGSWMNKNARWRENDPVLTTGYALVSLANCTKGL